MKSGIERLISDLQELGFDVTTQRDTTGVDYAVIPDFDIPAGTLAGRNIKLAIPAPVDYPRSYGASIHITPHLAEFGQVGQLRNVTHSNLGTEWQYWSYRFNIRSENPTNELMTQINEIFRKN